MPAKRVVVSVEGEVIKHIDRAVRAGARDDGNARRQGVGQLHRSGRGRQALLIRNVGTCGEALAEDQDLAGERVAAFGLAHGKFIDAEGLRQLCRDAFALAAENRPGARATAVGVGRGFRADR